MSNDPKVAAALEMVGADQYLTLAAVNLRLALVHLREHKALIEAILTRRPIDQGKLEAALERLQRDEEGHQGRLAFLDELRAATGGAAPWGGMQ